MVTYSVIISVATILTLFIVFLVVKSDELYNNALSLLHRKNVEVRNLVMGNRGMR